MPDSRQEQLESLYKELERRREYILSKFDNEEISDDDYFHYGIKYEIINNSLSIVLSYLLSNFYSIGVDSSARAIIEAFVILDIDSNGEINDTMKKMYRLSYSAVEQDNEENDLELNILSPNAKTKREQDFKELEEIACLYFNCKKKDLDSNYTLSNPYFYLLKDIDSKTSFEAVVNRYHKSNDNYKKCYKFFSMMIHPKEFSGQDHEDKMMRVREDYLTKLFPYIIDFLKEDKTDYSSISVSSFQNKLRGVGLAFENETKHVSDIFIRFEKLLPKNLFPYLYYFNHALYYLLIDIITCYIFRLYDLVTPKYKAFIEMSSVFLHFFHLHDNKVLNYENDALRVGTIYRFKDWEEKVNWSKIDKEAETLFFNYYNKHYSVNGVQGFITNLESQILYFIKDKNHSFTKLVRRENSEDYVSGNGSKQIYQLYKVSLDMEHASGYTFNQSSEVTEFFALMTLETCYELLLLLVKFYGDIIKTVDSSFKGFDGEISYIESKSKEYNKLAFKVLTKKD